MVNFLQSTVGWFIFLRPTAQFLIKGSRSPYRLDRNYRGDGFNLYIGDCYIKTLLVEINFKKEIGF